MKTIRHVSQAMHVCENKFLFMAVNVVDAKISNSTHMREKKIVYVS